MAGSLRPRGRGEPALKRDLERWARDTWRSVGACIHPVTGLPADAVGVDLTPSYAHTSPSNVAALVWSVLAARDLGLLSARQARQQCATILATLRGVPRHAATGLYFNWYDVATGDPAPHRHRGRVGLPFVSSVDNAWLAAALLLVGSSEPALSSQSGELLAGLSFAAFVSPDDEHGPLHGGFWLRRTRRPTVVSARLTDGSQVALTPHRYDMVNSETRIIEFVAIALGQRRPSSLRALAAPRRRYDGREVVASWGGSLFEVLAPTALVPEATWSPTTWGRNHVDTVALHASHARRLGHAEWGFSPALRPGGGYAEFGVPPIAAGAGYPSQWRGRSVVTPHAAGLALSVLPGAAHENLARLADHPGAYGPGGFVDSVLIGSGRAARHHLCFDQGLLLAGLTNAMTGDSLHRGFTTADVAAVVRPVVSDPAVFADATGAARVTPAIF